MAKILTGWPEEGLIVTGFLGLVAIASVFGGYEEAKPAAPIFFLVSILLMLFYRIGHMSRQEEIEGWIDIALLQDSESNRKLYARTFGEETMKKRVKFALDKRYPGPYSSNH